jgi:hydroxymethylglutaryl-CoA lyase
MGDKLLKICDVSPRDGLQNEKALISTDDKLALIDGLVESGLDYIELTSFVSPKAVPKMADADEVLRQSRAKHPHVRFTGLIFNEKGYERARAANANAVAFVLIVSDSLSRSNSGKTADEVIESLRQIARRAKDEGVWVRAYLAGAWVCPFEGQVAPERALHYADKLWGMGVDELCATDPIGHAHPAQVYDLMLEMARRYDPQKLAIHLHDTQALGLANAYAAMQAGIRIVDASLGGLGGCPFAPGAAGNLATEDLVLMAHKMGYETGVDLERLWQTVYDFEPVIGRSIGGRSRAWWDSEKAKSAVGLP